MTEIVTPSGIHGLGWRPDLPDWRDYDREPPALSHLPDEARLDLLPEMPPVYDQGRLGSCTANALAAAMQFDLRRQRLDDFVPSRLFIYYNERVLEKTVPYDAGAYIRDGAKVLHRFGVCSETMWPYDLGAFMALPSRDAYELALDTKAVRYSRVARWAARQILAAGLGFTVGFTVYDNFMTIGDDGVMAMPEGSVLGGHAVFVCGYAKLPHDGKLYYRVRNSWGDSWGDGGYFWMPRAYLETARLSQDFWTIELVS